MKVLIGCLSFKEFTGSEMYVYELSKKLVILGCEVTITAAVIGSPLKELAQSNAVQVIAPSDLVNKDFDIIHCQQTPVVEMLCRVYPKTPKVCTIHSEIISLEEPFKHKSIFAYIAIRQSIYDWLVKEKSILSNNIFNINNPIDETRFKPTNLALRPYILFVGTLDFLRKETLFDLVNYTVKEKLQLMIIGKDSEGYLPQLLKNPNVVYLSPQFNVEYYIQNAYQTAGIMLGRTTIEGWMCGRSGWIYDVDAKGHIKSKELFDTPNDIENYCSTFVGTKILELYIQTIK